ncbi:sigma 54-interacting transcriptional regulator [Desulfovibrio sp. OttesenSCG-928-C06]|nr:sigma 54-interacting transcriptional regulator [Desulfovibrio sp. OttesenSCG-928-C06]
MYESISGVGNVLDCLPYFKMLFDSIQIGIIIADANGRIIYYNKAQSGIDRLNLEDVLDRDMCEVYKFTPNTSPAMQVLRTGTPIVDRVHSYLTRSGNLVNASCTIYPLYKDGSEVFGAICFSQSYTALDFQLQNIQKDISQYKENDDAAEPNKKAKNYSFSSIVGQNSSLLDAVSLARIAATNHSTVMLVGETGVGKEIFAQSIHYGSSRAQHSYTAINCSAVPETLLEGILFGTAKGAFTGALNKPGLFEVSNKGTIFLDEVDSMPISLQSKLLRVLQERKIRRVGEADEREIDVRIISAVGRNPATLLKQGLLRPDFYYRLGVIKIFLPPLRERMDDVHQLVSHFLYKHSQALGRRIPEISNAAVEILYSHNWPGNVRELEHAIEASLSIMGASQLLEPSHLYSACPEIARRVAPHERAFKTGVTAGNPAIMPHTHAEMDASRTDVTGNTEDAVFAAFSDNSGVYTAAPPAFAPYGAFGKEEPANAVRGSSLVAAKYEAELNTIRNALRASAGNRSMAARLLDISPQLMYYKMKKYKLDAKDFAPGRRQ